MSQQPKISVIVPCYRVEKYLDRCLSSITKQTLSEIEIILVDDESPDQIPEMCDKWADRDSRIKVIHKKNGGDYLEPTTYQTMYNIAIKESLDICYFKHRRVSDETDIMRTANSTKEIDYYIGKQEIDDFMLDMVGRNPEKKKHCNLSMSVCMGIFRRDVILNSNALFVSEKVIASEDLIFHLKILPYVNKIGVTHYIFYNYYINPSSITANYNEGKYQRLLNLLAFVRDELLKTHSWNEIKNHYYSQQLRIIKFVLKFEAKSKCTLKERLKRIQRFCDEPIFVNLYKDPVINKYSRLDSTIVYLMKHRQAPLLAFIYRYFKK